MSGPSMTKNISDRIRDERISRIEKKMDGLIESLKSESHLENYDRAVVESTRSDLSSLKDTFNDTIGGVLADLDNRSKENMHAVDQLKIQVAEFSEALDKMKQLRNTFFEKIIWPVVSAIAVSILYQLFGWYMKNVQPVQVNQNIGRPTVMEQVIGIQQSPEVSR